MDSLCQQAVQASSKVLISLDNQFWGERYGILFDPFGHQWSMSMATKMSQGEMATMRKVIMSMFAKGEQQGKSN
jgi:PhnB protein